MNNFCYYDEAYTMADAHEFGWCKRCDISSCKYNRHSSNNDTSTMRNYMNMSPSDYIKIIEKKDAEIRRLKKVVEEVTENIKIVGTQNTKLKKKCDRYKKIMNRFYGEGLFDKTRIGDENDNI